MQTSPQRSQLLQTQSLTPQRYTYRARTKAGPRSNKEVRPLSRVTLPATVPLPRAWTPTMQFGGEQEDSEIEGDIQDHAKRVPQDDGRFQSGPRCKEDVNLADEDSPMMRHRIGFRRQTTASRPRSAPVCATCPSLLTPPP